MKVCIECGLELPESKFKSYTTKEGVRYTGRCRLCESRRTSKRRKQDRLHGRLARYTNEELVAELRKRGAYIMYGKDFEPITTI